MPRSREEILGRLSYHRKALNVLSELFDRGEPLAALGLAVSVYQIVHDSSNRDRSLLTQLGLRAGLRFVASAPPADLSNPLRQDVLTYKRIVMTERGAVGSYQPILGEGWADQRLIQFHRWWEQERIYLDGDAWMNRRKLTFTLRSQEGGTHYDAEIKNPYFEKMSTKGLTTPMVLSESNPPQPILAAEFAAMRQVAWELGETLDRAAIE